MGKHTPGPWKTVRPESQYSNSVRVFTERSQYLATVGGSDQLLDEIIANARLIAAAPELLEALQEVIEDGLKTNMESWITKAKDAIDKATGASA